MNKELPWPFYKPPLATWDWPHLKPGSGDQPISRGWESGQRILSDQLKATLINVRPEEGHPVLTEAQKLERSPGDPQA